MLIRDVCPRCQSPEYEKNGHIHNAKQNYQCNDWERRFVDCFAQHLVSDDTRALIERLLVERISLRGICRAVGATLKWLLGFLLHCVEALPDHLHVGPLTCHRDVMLQHLAVEADEMASFVQKKANKQWRGLALDAKTRQVIAVMGENSCGLSAACHVLHRSVCRVRRGDSRGAAPGVGPENSSPRESGR
jgi:insertion element IS1 protein InsB